MKNLMLSGFVAIAFAGSSISLGQQKADSLKQQLVGNWLVVAQSVEKDGKKIERFGSTPKGIFMFDGNGRFAAMLMRSDLPKFASNNAMAGTDEENKAVVQGSIAFYGTWSIPEAPDTVITRIEGSSYPNWDGLEQKRSMVIAGDELRLCVTAAIGGTSCMVAKRVK